MKKVEIKKIATNPVKQVVSKKGIAEKIFGFLFNGTPAQVKDGLVHDIVRPAVQNLMRDSVDSALNILISGEKKPPNISRTNGVSYVNYAKTGIGALRQERPPMRNTTTFNNVILQTRDEAENVVSMMADILDAYGQITVLDFYEMVGVKHQYTDRYVGWISLNNVTVRRERTGGYVVDMPRPMAL